MKAYTNHYISLTETNEENLLFTITGSHSTPKL